MTKPLRLVTFSRPVALLAAEAKGYFVAQGLRVTHEVTASSVAQMRGLLGGRWDVAHTAADNVMAYVDREGADLFIFLVADLGLEHQFVVRPEIESYAALSGTLLGVDAPDSGYASVLCKMLALNGVERGTYGLAPVGSTPKRFRALLDGGISGCLLSPTYDAQAVERGCRLLDPASRYFPLYPGLTAAATRRWADGHEPELRGYTRALLGAARWAADAAHVEEAIRLIARDRGADPAIARHRYAGPVVSLTDGVPDLHQVTSALEVVRELRREMTGAGGPLEAYFDPRYMRDALAGAG